MFNHFLCISRIIAQLFPPPSHVLFAFQVFTEDDLDALTGNPKVRRAKVKSQYKFISPFNLAERALQFQDSGFGEKQVLALVGGQGLTRDLVDALPHQKDGQVCPSGAFTNMD